MKSFYTNEELKELGLNSYGEDVLISRNTMFYHPEKVSVGNHVRIDDYTTISGNLEIGNYVHIAQSCNLYGGEEGIIMRDFSGLSAKVLVYATSNDYSGESLTNPTVPDEYANDVNARVELGRHVIIGCGSSILPGVCIGDGCAVGAMSLVNKSLPEWGIYAGIPVVRKKDRAKGCLDKEELLKKNMPECRYRLGDEDKISKTVTIDDIEEFASLTGDNNPIHFDDDEAKCYGFQKRIAHGMLSEGMISALIGTRFPGKGTIYLEQNMKFRKPVYVGDICTAKVKIIDIINEKKGIIKLRTEVLNQNEDIVTEGFAIVKAPIGGREI